ncbi:MAG: Crp/Fnr family transcriptional regulator [Bacteroidetes bacterium]|nr:Crp/Fnr family transcriptional regulator [Bacteroidota bacterium]
MDKTAFIKSIFDPYFEADKSVWAVFAEAFTERTFKRNQLIKEAGKHEEYLNIIVSGSAGIFALRNEQTVCLDLCYEQDVCCDYMSFLTQTPTPLYTQAFEPLQLLSVPFQALQQVYEQSAIGNKIGRLAAEGLYIHKQNQQIDLLTRTAEERYLMLMQKQPQVILRTPSKHIASFLGITPESMSRIRKNSGNQQTG